MMSRAFRIVRVALALLAAVLCAGAVGGRIANAADIDISTTFPNSELQRYVREHFDTNGDGKLSSTEISAATEIFVNGYDYYITSFEGIRVLTNLRKLSCVGCDLTSLNVSGNGELRELDCTGNDLASLNLTSNKKLERLVCAYNPRLTQLNLSANLNLKHLECGDVGGDFNYYKSPAGGLTTLDLRKNTKLEYVDCACEYIKTLYVTGLSNLKELYCNFNELTGLDLTGCTGLEILNCRANMQIKNLDVSGCKNLVRLRADNIGISSINLKNCSKLEFLDVGGNMKLSSLDVTSNPQLSYVGIDDTAIRKLNLANNPKIEEIDCWIYEERNPLETVVLTKAMYSVVTGATPRTYTKELIEYSDGWNAYRYRWEYKDVTGAPKQFTVFVNEYHDRPIFQNGYVKVSFDTNGAFQGTVASVYASVGKTITIPKTNLVKEKCYFLGWSTKASDTTARYKSGDKVTVTGYMTLYAVWKKASTTYHVSFNRMNGSGNAPSPRDVVPGTSLIIGESSLTRTGYYFLGWSKKQGSATAEFKTGSAVTVNGNLTLYAVWSPRKYKITYVMNGGTNNPLNPATYTAADGAIYLAAPWKSGYVFAGWYSDAALTKKTSGIAGGSVNDRKFYAKFTTGNGTTRKLSFNSNCKDGGPAPSKMPSAITAKGGSTVTIPKVTVTREGYWFLGWALRSTETAPRYKSGDKVILSNDTTLYAVWKKK